MFIKKFVLRTAGSSLAAMLLLAAPRLGAQTPSESERLQKLERAVDQLQKRNAELEQEVAGLKKHAAVAPEGRMKTKISYDGKTYVEKAVVEEEKLPIYVQQRGPELKLVLGGFIQANFEDDFENNDGLNSGRTAFEATDIFVNWHQFPEAQVKLGQWKAPFGLEQTTPDTTLYVIERSLPTGAITPERQIGVQLWGKPFASVWPDGKDLLTYYAGIFNGNGRNTTVNDNNNFMYVGRLESTLFKAKMWGQDSYLKLGADVLNSRDDKGTNISQTLNLLVNSDGSLSPFVLPGADERTAWSVDAWLKLGPFDLIGEYLEEYVNGRTVNGAPPGFADFTTNGYYITAGYFLFPKKLQAVVQWQDLNPGQKGNDGIHSITGGLNYYIHGDDIKLMVDYIHTWSDFRQAHPEFGEDQFDEVIGRVQLMF